ncbi:hypothetical protein GGF46_003608, partial [Coemansia sp. RSA 552]
FQRTVRWRCETPTTASQLERQREEFWDTAPAFEGRAEIWQALKLACTTEDRGLAQAILDSAGVTVPTGRITDGVYDDHGARYVVPQYCLSEPTNLLSKVGYRRSADSNSVDLRTMADGASTASADGLLQLRVRLISGVDAEVSCSGTDTMAHVEHALRGQGHIPPAAKNVRFFHLGRPLQSVRDIRADASTIQAMYS